MLSDPSHRWNDIFMTPDLTQRAQKRWPMARLGQREGTVRLSVGAAPCRRPSGAFSGPDGSVRKPLESIQA
ncbi:hypothetical protein SKAU_G00406370 [Synaphobranchus kaupii]|uniref:Uncharacterized protein n=1 Tax=Synaphobranchus kaupii TaxID=118154 RepID=A0A9Q1E9Z7_SYNKA|nr:hypothetical protein SKAU_G00406370 [Synaphobranchus kaupii]